MAESKVNVFFYGSFINRTVLAEVNLIPDQVDLVRSDQHSVYGIFCQATHAELDRLYSQPWVGTYLPEAVLVETSGGRLVPALCYIAPSPAVAPAADDYLDRIVGPACEYGFPAWYIARLESFRQRLRSGG